ncbi:MAG: thioesterase family protein [Actinomycetota bacterium]
MRISAEPSTDPQDYTFAHDIRVRFAETDAMKIVHHGNYLAYFEEARVEFLDHIGHPYTSWRDDGVQSPVLESYVRYRQPLHFAERFSVHVSLDSVTRATFNMAYLITVADEVRTTGITVHGCTTLDGRPTRLPGWLRELGAA